MLGAGFAVSGVKTQAGSIMRNALNELKWLKWEEIKADYDECSELLALFTSIGSK